MIRHLSPTLFSAHLTSEQSTQEAFHLSSAKEVGFEEEWLRDAIFRNPRLVIEACAEADLTDENWWGWKTEVSTPAGSIDVLLVSETGRVAIVETKLFYNPDKRRNVLAQVLDYAMSLPRVEMAVLPDLPKGCGVRREEVEEHIQQGDFLLIVAGDLLDSRAVRLGRALLGDHMVNEWDLAMVEVAVFKGADTSKPPKYLLVPHLRGVLERELRQVVKVEVEQGEVNVNIVRATEPGANGREKWTRERFFAELDAGKLPPAYKMFGHALETLEKDFTGTELRWGTGKSGSVTVKRNGHGLVEFYLNGHLGFRLERPVLALGNPAGEAYVAGVRKIFVNQVRSGGSATEYPWFVPTDPDVSLPALLELLKTALRNASEQ
jgi:hypothetical protein